MHALTLTDWTTIQGGSTSVTQGADQWLDMTPYQDVQLWLDVRSVTFSGGATPALQIAFETAPARDDILFQPMVAPTTMTPAAGPGTPVLALLSSASVPVAQWLRWKLTPTGSPTTFTATFRVIVAANSPGS